MVTELTTPDRRDTEGAIGIGAMIVFIALILVAAVASTIIIKTAEELQQNAESTSDDTRKEISGKVNIIQIIVNGSSGNDIDSLIVTAKIASGSTDVQVQDIEWAIICGGSNGFGLITGNLGTSDPAGGQILAADNEAVNADFLDGSDYAATAELSAGTTFKFDINLEQDATDDSVSNNDDTLDAGEAACNASAGVG
jgi:flagellin FlaB